jgi:nucleosome binding factor SPN SPT16 subunit
MTPVEATGLVGAFTALLTSFFVPMYLNRRRERTRAARNTEVTWEAINRALVTERDLAKTEARDEARAHEEEMRALRVEHQRELAELRQRYDGELSHLRARVEEYRQKVSELHSELYDLRKRIPPA